MYPAQPSAPPPSQEPFPPNTKGVPQSLQEGIPPQPQQGVANPQVGAPPYDQQAFPGQNQNGSAPTEWSTGLCGCGSDLSNCCITCCCPCITFGQIAEILDRGTTSFALGAVIYFALACVACPCIYSCGYRTKLRSLYSLKEAPCGDFLVHCCCEACALCQEYRELKLRGADPALGWQGNVERWNRDGSTVPPTVYPGMSR